jgi:hypothetical protein
MAPVPRRSAHSRLLAPLLCVGALVLSLGLAGPASARALPAAPAAPTEGTWLADVGAVMQGARPFLRERAAQAGPDARLAINLDIDNTSLATYYDRGRAVRKVRNAARLATTLGYTVLFNTGRLRSRLGSVRAELTRAGYAVGAVCTRKRGELLPVGKQRCRAAFVAQGYTIVANIGNNDSDFEGADYERAFRLPNYDGALG